MPICAITLDVCPLFKLKYGKPIEFLELIKQQGIVSTTLSFTSDIKHHQTLVLEQQYELLITTPIQLLHWYYCRTNGHWRSISDHANAYFFLPGSAFDRCEF